MADGMAWEDLTPELEGPGVGIRRMDAGGLATCLIRLDAGLKTDPLFAGLPDDRCQCAHWGYIVSGTMRVHSADGSRLAHTSTSRRTTPRRDRRCGHVDGSPASSLVVQENHAPSA